MSKRIPFRPKQSLGQNFLQDPNMADKIIESLEAPAGARVVEVGAGTGMLTERLAEQYEHLTALEIDERAVEVLRERVPEVDVRQEDVRDTDWERLAAEAGGERLYVISNMPYYLTSPLLFSLLEQRDAIAQAVLTMQEEVADRLVAEPKTKAYGILSVLLQLFADPEFLFSVPPQVFTPQPDVTSAVVRLRFDRDPPHGLSFDDVRRYVRAAFNQRRKMLRNSLSAWTKDQGVDFPDDWGRKRAEALTPEQFATLARHLNAHADPVHET